MRTMLKSALTSLATTALLVIVLPMSAHAGMFDDDEARKAILDLRAQVDALQHDLSNKADKNSALSLSDQGDQLQQEIAKLRGQVEVLTNELANVQQRQKDFYVDLDTRLRALEPQKVTVDGAEVSVAPEEQKAYDAALAQFKSGDYKGASTSLSEFLKRFPKSGYAGSAQYWLGNAWYAQRNYKAAITAQQLVIKNYPDNQKVPDALLNLASSQAELKDKAAARKSLELLINKYPDSQAAQTGKTRLPSLK